ncbi:DUF1440 domain-containing protein [Jatrophihabitans endophyticus]|uniref:DUF1440 domain-containing protein n=1 Tax=Jatrophihabitans endophyticus TaxID=1206085 RepID=UPI001A04D7F9|nr:DUF1440 domain-containing protein [Jatrophihabitans endophyticus]MBE7187436.1 DUF1440 domain-containing protein [Jatrophihabitans endophyticus]
MTLVRSVAFGLLAGAAATVAKTKAEERLQPLSERVFPPEPAQKTGIGADSAGHPENMPPAEVADRAVHAVTGGDLTDEQRQQVSPPLHWAMGLGAGVAYSVVFRHLPLLSAGRGLVAGAALFAATHGSTLPAAGMQQPPKEMPLAWWGWEAGSHLVYGVVLDSTLSALDASVDRLRG